MLEIPLVVAFLAGIVSFASPCLLPLVPGYLAWLGGTNLAQAKTARLNIFINSLLFVLGFSAVFSSLGVLLNTLLEAVAYDAQIWLSRIGGSLVVFFGLYLVGLVRLPFLAAEYKINAGVGLPRFASSFVFGAAFAAGWTPCVGVVLGSILGLAATTPGTAFGLLLSYSLGLGLPFLVVGLFTAQAAGFFGKLGPWLPRIRVAFGILLVILGILSFTQNLAKLANFGFLLQLLGK